MIADEVRAQIQNPQHLLQIIQHGDQVCSTDDVRDALWAMWAIIKKTSNIKRLMEKGRSDVVFDPTQIILKLFHMSKPENSELGLLSLRCLIELGKEFDLKTIADRDLQL